MFNSYVYKDDDDQRFVASTRRTLPLLLPFFGETTVDVACNDDYRAHLATT